MAHLDGCGCSGCYSLSVYLDAPEGPWMRALLDHLWKLRGVMGDLLVDPLWWSPLVPLGVGVRALPKFLRWLTMVCRTRG